MAIQITDRNIEEYCIEHSNHQSEVMEQLAEYTRKNISMSQMLIGPLEAGFLAFLIRSIGAQRVLEFGCFTGYSALAMAEALGNEGEVITLDVNEETTQLAQSFWDKSPHGKKITAKLGPALESLSKLEGEFDFIFIDADKENYLSYLKASFEILSKDGVIAVDNCFKGGRVLDKSIQAPGVNAIQEMNEYVKNSPEMFGVLLPVRDGLYLVRRS